MAKLSYSDIKIGKLIEINGNIFEVIESQVSRTQQRKPQNQTKLKNLVTGSVVQRSFHTSENVTEADVEKKNIVFIYERNGEVFLTLENSNERFSVKSNSIRCINFIKSNSILTGVFFEEKMLYAYPPIKVDLVVKESPPSIRGNTAQGGSKHVKLETGAMVSVPLFINEGDTLKINTETGEYTERSSKK